MSETTLLPPGIYIGGLRNDLHPGRLAGLLCNLLYQFQVEIPKQNVHITRKPNIAYAIIDLPDEETSQYLLSELSFHKHVQNAFDLSTISNNPHSFRVGPKLIQGFKRQRSRSRSRNRKKEKKAVATSQNAAHNSRSASFSHPQSGIFISSMDSRNIKQQERQFLNKMINSQFQFVKENRSRTSQQSSEMSQPESDQEEEPGDYFAPNRSVLEVLSNSTSSSNNRSSSSPSVSKVLSNSTVSSKGSDYKQSDTDSLLKSYGLQAGGVLRLAREFGVDAASRSVSDHIYPTAKKTATTSTTGLPVPGQVSVTTSTPGASTGLARNFYRLGEVVGRESRHSEFKQGGMAHKERSWLQDTVGKYVCGFLNSSEGGTLYIGVNDQGVVTGFSCPQFKEDNFRLLIDEALKSIEPPIFTDIYTVRFVPIMDLKGICAESLCVLEIEVKAVKHLKQLYDFRGNAYLRRDGSLQGPLKSRQVQEWTRKQLERENSGVLLKSQLREMSSQLQEEREKTANMQQQLLELEAHVTQVKLDSRHQSQICVLI